MTRALIIDDHKIVLHGCRRLLEDAGACEVLTAGDLVTGYRLYRRTHPDVMIVDLAIQGNGLGGLMLIRRVRLRDKTTPILVLSMHGDPVIVSRALEAGATGYLVKDAAAEDLVEAFEAVSRGAPFLSHQLALQVAVRGTRGSTGSLAEISTRELQTLALIAEGKAYAQIAEELGLSYKTVANTGSQLKMKLAARNLPELIRKSIEYLATLPNRRPNAPTGR